MVWVVTFLLLVSLYVIFNLFRKNESLEEANEEANKWLISYYTSLDSILSNIKKLDSKQMFESDDEVGSVFNAITKEIKKLEDLIEKE